MVPTYDPLEDRRTIDVIITKFFPLCFKMAKSFENLDNILRDWAKDKVQKSLVQTLKGTKSREKKNKAEKYSNPLSRQSSVENWSW